MGAGLVLVVTFVALAVLWPKPRLQGGPLDRPIHSRWLPALGWLFGASGVAALALVVMAGLTGLDNSSRNPASVIVYVLFWLVVPFGGALLGNLYTLANPWRLVLLPLAAQERPVALARLGVWPATLALIGFTWLELVHPQGGSPRIVAFAAIAYTAWLGAWVANFGRDTGLQVGDGFTVYNRLISAIAPFGRRAGGLVWRGWLRALPALPAWRGLPVFVVAMIGTVTYDGLSSSLWWLNLTGSWGQTIGGETLALLATVSVIGAGYLGACAVAARLGGGEWTASAVAVRFAHTLVPIALAYAFAHYFTLVIFEGQLLISTLSDPFGRGWDLFGTADRRIDFSVIGPIAVWYVQVAAIVGGHVLGVVLAHDRALQDFPPALAVRTQYALLVLMVGLTGLGLTVLAAG